MHQYTFFTHGSRLANHKPSMRNIRHIALSIAIFLGTMISSPAWAEESGFIGDWKTTYGNMQLRATENEIQGVYYLGGEATISGKVEGSTLRFEYKEPSGAAGYGVFTLAEDQASFSGHWREGAISPEPLNENDKTWSGKRIIAKDPTEKATWLVVLEPHWEQSIEESEFSYGQMLREYYRRIPSLQFRHRRVHDKEDFLRVGKEISAIDGNVILYISSHGTEKGATLSDGTLAKEQVITVLRESPNVRLLHFGCCLVAGGSVPEEILKALPKEKRIPISGFTKVADWGGSALTDFAYLDNLIERKLSPKEAVAATRRNLLFARETSPGPVPPMDLRIVLPEDIN
jgi:hypothetical protein